MILSLDNFAAMAPAKVIRKKTLRKRNKAIGGFLVPALLDLIRLRVAQLRGCKWCVQEQMRKLKAQGETAQRLRVLKDWRKQTIFTNWEEAALNLAEALTHHPISTVPGEVVHAAFLFFNESEMTCLILVSLDMNDVHYLEACPGSQRTNRPPHE